MVSYGGDGFGLDQGEWAAHFRINGWPEVLGFDRLNAALRPEVLGVGFSDLHDAKL